MTEAKSFEITKINKREGKSTIYTAKDKDQEVSLFDKEDAIKEIGNYLITYYTSDYEGKTYTWVKSAVKIDMKKLKDEFEQANNYKREEPSRDMNINRQSARRDAIEFINHCEDLKTTKWDEKKDIILELSELFEKWAMR